MKQVWDGNLTSLTQYMTENRLGLFISLHCHFSSFLLLLLAWIENKSYFKFSWIKELWKLNFTNNFQAKHVSVWPQKQSRNSDGMRRFTLFLQGGFPLVTRCCFCNLHGTWQSFSLEDHQRILPPPPHFICGILKAKNGWVGQDDIVTVVKPGNRAWTSPAPSINQILLPVPATEQHNSKMHSSA